MLTAGIELVLLVNTGKKSSSKMLDKNGLKVLLEIVGNIALSSFIFKFYITLIIATLFFQLLFQRYKADIMAYNMILRQSIWQYLALAIHIFVMLVIRESERSSKQTMAVRV